MLRLLTLGLGLLAVVLLPLLLTPQLAYAGTHREVDVELVLAVDVSWSMDIDEQRLQREGYVAALRDPDIIAAIRKGDLGVVAITYVEWAGVGLERTVVPWSLVSDEATAASLADKLEAAPIGRLRRTSISSALSHVATLFQNEFDGLRRVIDISGDGPNNMGMLVTSARDDVLAQGITINGLPIMIKRGGTGGYFQIEDLDLYYEDCVIGGSGAFMITVDDAQRFQEAIRRKLILEIAGLSPRAIPAQFAVREPRVDCAVGEKQWRRWRTIDQW